MNLHILNCRESSTLALYRDDDAVILIEDGVYQNLDRPAYILRADLKARGLEPKPNQTLVDYDGFVQLCANCSKVITW